MLVSYISVIIASIGACLLIFWTYIVYPYGLFIGVFLFLVFVYAAYQANLTLLAENKSNIILQCQENTT